MSEETYTDPPMEEGAERESLVFEQPSKFEDFFEINSSALIGHLLDEGGRDAYEAEYEMWLSKLRGLPPYKDDVVMRLADEAMEGLEMTVSPNDTLVHVASVYAGLTRARKALGNIRTPVTMRLEVLKDATKSLKSGARGMFKGTEKDKDAQCDRMVRHLVGEQAQARALQTYLEERINQVEFAVVQAARVLKERQEQAKANYSWVQEGLSNNYNAQATELDDDDPLPPEYRRRT